MHRCNKVAQRRADAAQARANSERCREVQARFDGPFAGFGVMTPQAKDGEDADAYRCRLFRRLLKRLPPDHELVGIEPSELPEIALDNLEQQLIAEAAREAASPSEANLPADGSLIARNRVDSATGERSVEWHGRESFLKSMGREGRRGAAHQEPADRIGLVGTAYRDRSHVQAVTGLLIAATKAERRTMVENFRHHVAHPGVLVIGSPAPLNQVKPGPYPRQERSYWRPQTRPPSKAAASKRLFDAINQQEQAVREMMTPSPSGLRAWLRGAA